MNSNLTFDFTVNKENNTITVKREFNAGLELVWEAWTNPEILDQWWAPKPYQSETKTMDFREGGFRLYAMVSPKDEKHWGREDYQKIDTTKNFTASKIFCDENGNESPGVPRSVWHHTFSENTNTTTVNIVIQYENVEHIEMMIKMGFKEGFAAGLENLDELLDNKTKNE